MNNELKDIIWTNLANVLSSWNGFDSAELKYLWYNLEYMGSMSECRKYVHYISPYPRILELSPLELACLWRLIDNVHVCDPTYRLLQTPRVAAFKRRYEEIIGGS